MLSGKLKQEQLFGLLFVLALHGAALYGLWRYHIIPTPHEAVTLMVDFISPPAPEKPRPKLPEPPKPKHRTIVPPPEHTHLLVNAPVLKPDEAVAYVPPAPVPEPPVLQTPPVQPVSLSGELSVSCPERSAPDYPALSMRLNEQGKVVLRVELGTDGQITNVSFKTHSGFARLDEAAVRAVKGWRCKPATRGGVAVAAVALQPFDFILEGH